MPDEMEDVLSSFTGGWRNISTHTNYVHPFTEPKAMNDAFENMRKLQQDADKALLTSLTSIPYSVDYEGSSVHPDGYRIVLGHEIAKRLGLSRQAS